MNNRKQNGNPIETALLKLPKNFDKSFAASELFYKTNESVMLQFKSEETLEAERGNEHSNSHLIRY